MLDRADAVRGRSQRTAGRLGTGGTQAAQHNGKTSLEGALAAEPRPTSTKRPGCAEARQLEAREAGSGGRRKEGRVRKAQ